MENFIELKLLTTKYSTIKKLIRRLENLSFNLEHSLSNKASIKFKIEETISNLTIQINNSKSQQGKFKLAIMMGNTLSTIKNNNDAKLIYNLSNFTVFPAPLDGTDNNNFIVDFYSKSSFVLIDEYNHVFTIKKYFENYAINLTNDECIFISNESIELLKREVLRLLNDMCYKGSKLLSDDKIKFGIYKEKMIHIFNHIHYLFGYDLKKYYLNGLDVPNLKQLVSKSVVKLFNGEALKPFEIIAIAKLTDNQILDILNHSVQVNYNNNRLKNYLSNISSINSIVGSTSFKQYVDQPVNQNTEANGKIIEVDFVKKRLRSK